MAIEIRQTFELGVTHYREGRMPEAERTFRQILKTAPDHAPSVYNLGLILHQRGQITEAIEVYRRALAISPTSAEVYNGLGKALMQQQGQWREAEEVLRVAVRIKPDYVDAYINLGLVLEEQHRLAEAEHTYREAIKHKPDFAGTYVNLGNVLEAQGQLTEAEQASREALKLAPDLAGAHMNLANVLKSQGHMTEAEKAYRAALNLRPDYAEAFGNLVTIKRYESIANDDVARMVRLLRSPAVPEHTAMHLHFALGKIYDDCGACDEAFSHYREANRIKRKTFRFNASAFSIYVDRLIQVFDSRLFAERRQIGSNSELPVFIIGMPRSGTTLVEQIISSHPYVHGAGELHTFDELAHRLSDKTDISQGYPEAVRHLDATIARELIHEYENRLRRDAGSGVRRISDKMPLNHIHLGLVVLLFPSARVIHCQRDPLDVGLSIYFHYFRSGNDYAYDLSDIGHYYREYERLMVHWQSVLPLKMHEIQYEALVSDQERQTRELIDFLDLPWDRSCLAFAENRRPIQTGSAWQARQPIYKSSVRRWRKYEKHLVTLKEALRVS